VIRRLFNVASAFSLLLSVAMAVLWTLSYNGYTRFVIRNSGSRVQLVEGSCVLCRPSYIEHRSGAVIVTPVILEIPLSPLAAALGLLPSIWFVRRLLRRPRINGFCSCRYNLTANASGVCPECGTPVPRKSEAEA